jgi:hypothetical protein
MIESRPDSGQPEFSRRAARRLIQRALVLVERNRSVRQHIREARLTTLWVLEDWEFDWTVFLDRGKLEFDRRGARKPHVTLVWPVAAGFFKWVESDRERDEFRVEGKPEDCRMAEVVCRAFRSALAEVIQFPVDDEGVSLV